ncbi:MAG: hypothetical protein HUU54_14700 [Ignavibacteriaceae bacterium]|nr:hypothetical protein [Ignavibacteriaceae bacterium]
MPSKLPMSFFYFRGRWRSKRLSSGGFDTRSGIEFKAFSSSAALRYSATWHRARLLSSHRIFSFFNSAMAYRNNRTPARSRNNRVEVCSGGFDMRSGIEFRAFSSSAALRYSAAWQ